MTHRVTGVIKSIKRVEGYAFVTHLATGEDYFFHRSALKEGVFAELEVDDVVSFEPVDGPKGKRALEVRVQ